MPEDGSSSKHTATNRDGISTRSSKANKSDADDTYRITSDACVFPEQTFVSKTNSTLESQTKTEDEKATFVEKDGPWAWIACCCAIMNQLIIFGTLNVYTIFLVKFVSEFDVATATAGKLNKRLYKLVHNISFGCLSSG